jgi:pyrroline-5-carboxylate reductase
MELEEMKIGFIGAGNMSSAIINGLLKSSKINTKNVFVSDNNNSMLDKLSGIGVNTSLDNLYVVQNSDIIIIAVKPNVYQVILQEIAGVDNIEAKIIVSIAPGISINYIKSFFSGNIKVVRTMPNTPALIGEGMTVTCYESPVTIDEYKMINEIFDSVGIVEQLSEKLMNEVVAVNGSSPAYVYIMIEAMADAAVMRGIPRELAYRLSAQSIVGAGKMVIETGNHPGKLKDMVCSPGGTTIQAVSQLEKSGFRTAIIQAMEKCTEKAIELGKR